MAGMSYIKVLMILKNSYVHKKGLKMNNRHWMNVYKDDITQETIQDLINMKYNYLATDMDGDIIATDILPVKLDVIWHRVHNNIRYCFVSFIGHSEDWENSIVELNLLCETNQYEYWVNKYRPLVSQKRINEAIGNGYKYACLDKFGQVLFSRFSSHFYAWEAMTVEIKDLLEPTCPITGKPTNMLSNYYIRELKKFSPPIHVRADYFRELTSEDLELFFLAVFFQVNPYIYDELLTDVKVFNVGNYGYEYTYFTNCIEKRIYDKTYTYWHIGDNYHLYKIGTVTEQQMHDIIAQYETYHVEYGEDFVLLTTSFLKSARLKFTLNKE